MIPLIDILHIDLKATKEMSTKKGPDRRLNAKALTLPHMSEERRVSTKLYLKGGAGLVILLFIHQNSLSDRRNALVCVLDSFNSNHIAKAIVSSWHSALIRKSAEVRNASSTGQGGLAAEYYSETVKSLHEAQSQHEAMEIVEDFSEEVLNDLTLKDVFFRSKELLMTCIELLQFSLCAPPDFGNDFPSFQRDTALPMERAAPADSSATHSAERRNKLKMVVLQRLKLVFVVLKVSP